MLDISCVIFDLITLFYLRMLIPKKNRVAIYEFLFKEGVMVAKKDFNLPSHPELEGVPNLHVIKAMQVKRRYQPSTCGVF